MIQRRGQYGHPQDYFSSKLWADYEEGFGDIDKGVAVTSEEIPDFEFSFLIQREKFQPKWKTRKLFKIEFCQNPTQPKSNWQLQPTTPTNSNWWLTVGFDFVFMRNKKNKNKKNKKKNLTKNIQLLHYVGSWNLVCELNIAQLEEIWSKNW